MITFDKMLTEYFYTRDDNGAFFDICNQKDCQELTQFIAENKTGLLNEFSIVSLLKAGVIFVKNKFKTLTERIADVIGSKDINTTFEVTIPYIDVPEYRALDNVFDVEQEPAEKPAELTEGSVESIKGNYNEVLTCRYVIKKNKTPIKLYIVGLLEEAKSNDGNIVVVDLDSDGKNKAGEINALVNRWDQKLKIAAKDKYAEIVSVIDMASHDMADYIIKNVGTSGGVILAIWLVNREYMKGASYKADIKLKIKKGGGEFLKNFSLKMYSNTSVNLINSTLISSVKNWCGEQASAEMKRKVESDDKIQRLIKLERLIHGAVKRSKAEEKPKDYRDFVNAMYKVYVKEGFQISIPNSQLYTTDGLRIIRGNVREKINPMLATYFYEFLKRYISKPEGKDYFIKNFLMSIGFSDKDTDFILAVVGSKQMKDKKSMIIDKHPELNFDNMKLEHTPGTVGIRIVNDGKNIATLGFKEGKFVTGLVKFD